MVPVLLPPHPSLALRYSQYFAPFLNSSLFALGSNHPFCRGSSLGGPAGAALSPRDFMCASFLSFYPPAARGAGEREKKPGKEVKRKVGGETSLASFDMSRARCEEEGEGEEMAGRRRRLLPPPPLPRGTMGEERKGGASEGGNGGGGEVLVGRRRRRCLSLPFSASSLPRLQWLSDPEGTFVLILPNRSKRIPSSAVLS